MHNEDAEKKTSEPGRDNEAIASKHDSSQSTSRLRRKVSKTD